MAVLLFSLLLLIPVAPPPDESPPGADPVVLTDHLDSYAVGPHLEYLEDPEGQWTLSDVSAAPISASFESSRRAVPSFGYTGSTYWLRFAVRDEAGPERSWFLQISNKSLDRVEVYTIPEIEGFGVKRLGDALPYGTRDVRHRSFVVRLPENAATYAVVLRVASRGPVRIPLQILSDEGFVEKDRGEHLFLGAFFGILLLMAVYNLSLYAALRERSYLFYVLYIASYVFYMLSVERFGFAYLWPDNLWWAERANSFLALFCAIWGIQFSRSYLQSRQYTLWLDRFLSALGILCLPLMALVLVGPRGLVNPTVATFFLLTPSTLMATGIVCLLRGDRAAVYYVAAWSFLLAGTILGMLGNLDVLSHPLLGTRSVQLGSVMEMTLLSLGLGYRYEQLRRDRERMRMRIATDLHDDIGSGLTQISLYSELVRRAASGQTARWAEESGVLARELTGKMQDIVWAVRPEQEGWDALQMRMKDSATRLLAPREIAFDMQGEVLHPNPELTIEVRENVLMMFKEIVHNAVKHSNCFHFEVRYRLTRNVLWLRFCDDGCGFDPETVERGNGLRNLLNRAQDLRAVLQLDTSPGGPTCCTINIPLRPPSRPNLNGWRPAASNRFHAEAAATTMNRPG